MLSIMIFSIIAPAVHAAEIFDAQEQIAHSKEMIDLSNEKEKKAKTLEIAIMQNEINKITKAPDKTVIDAAQTQSQDGAKYEAKLQEMQKTIDSFKSSESKKTSDDQNDKNDIYYTGYMEFSGNKQAEMLVGGSRQIFSVGDEIYPGQRIKSISESGITTSTKSGTQIFTLKSSAQVSQKIYENAAKKVRSERNQFGNGNQSLRSPPSMSANQSGF